MPSKNCDCVMSFCVCIYCFSAATASAVKFTSAVMSCFRSEGVRKLIGLAYAQQKLRLRDELLRLHILFLRRDCERREVHICSDVLFSGSFIWVVAHRVLTNRLQRSAMPSCKLLLAVVAVVDDHRESAFQ